MEQRTSTSTPELVHALGYWAERPGPLYLKLAHALRAALEAGLIATGSDLPAERKLAAALSVSRTTVSAAYAELRDGGWVESRQGSATRVTAARYSPVGAHRANGLFATMMRHHPDVLDLTIAVPSAAPVVHDVMADPARFVDGERMVAGHGYDPRGDETLRTKLAAILSNRGLPTDPDELLVTTGAQQAISIAVRGLIRTGDRVAIEEVSFPGAIDALSVAGGRAVPLRVTEDGVDPAQVEGIVGRGESDGAGPRLMYLIPSFHNPSGALLAGSHRRRVADAIAASETLTIDDMTLAELDFGADAPPPLAALRPDAPIITIGSMSKVFWGGLRVGWLRARAHVVEHLVGLKTTADLGSPLPMQILAGAMLERYEETRAWRNERLTESLSACTEVLDSAAPEWEWELPLGGPHLWIRLPGTDALSFAHSALRAGVAVVAGPLLSVGGDAAANNAADRIRIPFYRSPYELTDAIQRLADTWRRTQRTARSYSTIG